MIEIITKEEFDNEVIEASKTDTVVVDFWAPWCGPCLMLKPTLEELEEKGHFSLVAINVDESTDIPKEFGIRSIPTVLIYKNGEIHNQFIGALPEEKILDKIGDKKDGDDV